MRVLHVAQPTVAGVPVVVRTLAADQSAAGWQVVVASPSDGDLANWLGELAVPHFEWRASREPGRSVPGETRQLSTIVRHVAPDLVHLHSAKAGLVGRLALRGSRPTVYQPHAWSFEATGGPVHTAARSWERYAARWTQLFICVSEEERRRGESVGIRGRKVVVPNGVDLTRFQPADAGVRAAARRALGLQDQPTVVCVGRLARQKGQDVLLAAVPLITRDVPKLQVILVGDGPDEELLRRAAPDGVIFAGGQPDPRPWLAAADVVAMPSRWEGGSLVVLEAMAVARSIVATDVGSAAEVLRSDDAVVAADDPEALAQALVVRLLDPALAEREGQVGRARVEAEYDVAVACRRVRDAYGLVVPGSRPPRGGQ